MEPRLSFGTIICVFVTVAFGIYCLYPSAVLNRRDDEVQCGLANEYRFVDGQSQPQRSNEQRKQPGRTSLLSKRPLE